MAGWMDGWMDGCVCKYIYIYVFIRLPSRGSTHDLSSCQGNVEKLDNFGSVGSFSAAPGLREQTSVGLGFRV